MGYGDYVYSNKNDTLRFKVFQTDLGWDADVYKKGEGYIQTIGVDGACLFKLKRDVINDIKETFGDIKLNNKLKTMDEGW